MNSRRILAAIFSISLILLFAFASASSSLEAKQDDPSNLELNQEDLPVDGQAVEGAVPNALLPDSDPITLIFPAPAASPAPLEELAALLAQESGYTVNAFIPGCTASAIETLGLGQADIGFLAALGMANAFDTYGAKVALVAERFDETGYRSEFLVRKDSDINSINDLAGKNIALRIENSATGHALPVFYLHDKYGIDAETFFGEMVITNSHKDIGRAVYYGQHEGTPVHSGASYVDVRYSLEGELPDIFPQTRLLDYTYELPNDGVSLRPGLDAAVAADLTDALRAVAATPEGQAVLMELAHIENLKPTSNSAYDITRRFADFENFEYQSCSQVEIVTTHSGGSLQADGDEGQTTTIQIPPAAVSDTLQISLSPLAAVTQMPQGLAEGGFAIEIQAVISGTTQIEESLNKPYELNGEYQDDQLGLANEESLAWYYWDGRQWLKEPSSTVDTVKNEVTATPTHFSRWAVMGQRFDLYLPIVAAAR